MQKWTIFMLISLTVVVSIIWAGNGFAASFDSLITMQEKHQFSVDLGYEFYQREMVDDDDDKIDAQGSITSVKASYGLTDQFHVFARIGMANLKYPDTGEDLGWLLSGLVFDDLVSSGINSYYAGAVASQLADRGVDDPNFQNELQLGFGIGGQIYRQENMSIGFLIQATHWQGSDEQSINVDGRANNIDYHMSASFEVEMDAWEYELGLISAFNMNEAVTPYFGLVYSKIESDVDLSASYHVQFDDDNHTTRSNSDGGDGELEENTQIGAVVGVSFNPAQNLVLNLEGLLINQNSFSFNIKYLF